MDDKKIVLIKKRKPTETATETADAPNASAKPPPVTEPQELRKTGERLVLKKKDKSLPVESPPPTDDPSIISSQANAVAEQDSLSTPLSVSMASPQRTATTSSFGGGGAVDQCDLCQGDIVSGTVDAHVQSEHADLIARIAKLTVGIHNLKENAAPLKDRDLEAFGAFIESDVASADQGEAVFKRALAAHEQVSRLVLRRFPQCKVFMFGSTVAMGSWDGSGDIDLTIVDPKGWDNGSWPGKNDKEGTLVNRLAGICREGGFSHDDLEPLCRVRVPVLKHKRPFKLDLCEHTGKYIVKFKFDRPPSKQQEEDIRKYFEDAAVEVKRADDVRFLVVFHSGVEAFDQYMMNHRALPPHKVFWDSFATAPEMFGIDFDLSARAHGIRNSWLLRKYMEQSSLVRAGSVFLKHWSKTSAVNYSMKGYFTSYATNMLWVFFLLQKGLVNFIDPLVDVEGSAEKSPVCGTYIPLIAEEDKKSAAFARKLSSTLYDFFCFYAYGFNWDTDVVSVSRTERTTKESLGWTLDKEVRTGSFRDRVWYRVCIEDPFEKNLNLGRHASTPKALKIRSQFFRGALVIASGDFKNLLQDNTTNNALERLQKAAPRVLLKHNNSCTLETMIAELTEMDPDLLASVETEFTVRKVPDMCGFLVEADGTLGPLKANSFVNSSCQELVLALDDEVAAAGAYGVPISVLHEVNNVLPLYYASQITKRLFGNAKHMRRFDEHFTGLKRVNLPGTKESILIQLKEKVPKIDVKIVETILADSRFVVADGRGHFDFSRKAKEDEQKLMNQKEEMDVTTKQMGNCDECRKRSTVYGSTLGGKHRYCERCWIAYSQ